MSTPKVVLALLTLVIGTASAQDAPDNSPEVEFGDGEAWVITDNREWKIGESGITIIVPQGFVHDKASTPRQLWMFLPKSDTYTRATVIHDYLYWSQHCTREQADNLMMIAMKESDVGWFKRNLVYWGVRGGGESAWNKNHQQRAAGMPRVNPTSELPSNISWKQHRQNLIRDGYRDPPLDPRMDYCALGNSTDVPSAKTLR